MVIPTGGPGLYLCPSTSAPFPSAPPPLYLLHCWPGSAFDPFSAVIRSRVQFTKSVDGSQTLSYEEDVVIKQKEKPKMRSLGKDDVVKGTQKTGQRALYTFLELLK